MRSISSESNTEESSETATEEPNTSATGEENTSETTQDTTTTTSTEIEETGETGETSEDSGGIAIAEASDTGQQDDAYPAPSIDATAVITEEYVPPTVAPNITVTPAEIGIGGVDNNNEGETEGVEDGSTADETTAEGDNTQLILWGGFIAALLLFISGILGALIIFRRNQQNQ